MDTFLIRTLLIPSLVVLMGRWNWWPSVLARRAERAETVPARTASMGAGHAAPTEEAV
jgi:RND superfamily putative drug exporter